MEEPAKSGKGEKKRAAKTVIGTRERRTQGEPVMEGEAVVGRQRRGLAVMEWRERRVEQDRR